MEIKRIFDLLPNYLEKYPDQPVALAGKKDGEWRKYSMKEYIELTDKLSWALIELGIEVGDKLTMIGYKDTYKGTIELCGGIYFSHEKGQ